MGKDGAFRNRVVGCFFWLKVCFAAAISCAGLAFMSYTIYMMHYNFTHVSEGGIGGGAGSGMVSSPVYISPKNPECTRQDDNAIRLNPPNGRMMFGVALDWSIDTPTQYVARTGIRPAVTNVFLTMTPSAATPLDFNMLTWHIQQVALTGSMLELSIMPSTLAIPDDVYTTVATKLLEYNSKYGVPILLRFGHEMNGNWMVYGYQPVQYIQAFRKMAAAVRAQTNLTAMMWAPNIGLAYPFAGTLAVSLPTNQSDPANFKALDSNNDGVINGQDDPYGPFYPGDDVVDWVGISLYWYEGAGVNVAAQPGYIVASLTGAITGASSVGLNLTARNFYDRFSQSKNKPMALPESGMPWAPNLPPSAGMTELLAKQSWWTQIFSPTIYAQFPLLKLVVNFEELKSDQGVGADLTTLRDWRYSNQTAISTSFTNYLKTQGNEIAFAGSIKLKCNGELNLI